jgi:hypothetical protein
MIEINFINLRVGFIIKKNNLENIRLYIHILKIKHNNFFLLKNERGGRRGKDKSQETSG